MLFLHQIFAYKCFDAIGKGIFILKVNTCWLFKTFSIILVEQL